MNEKKGSVLKLKIFKPQTKEMIYEKTLDSNNNSMSIKKIEANGCNKNTNICNSIKKNNSIKRIDLTDKVEFLKNQIRSESQKEKKLILQNFISTRENNYNNKYKNTTNFSELKNCHKSNNNNTIDQDDTLSSLEQTPLNTFNLGLDTEKCINPFDSFVEYEKNFNEINKFKDSDNISKNYNRLKISVSPIIGIKQYSNQIKNNKSNINANTFKTKLSLSKIPKGKFNNNLKIFDKNSISDVLINSSNQKTNTTEVEFENKSNFDYQNSNNNSSSNTFLINKSKNFDAKLKLNSFHIKQKENKIKTINTIDYFDSISSTTIVTRNCKNINTKSNLQNSFLRPITNLYSCTSARTIQTIGQISERSSNSNKSIKSQERKKYFSNITRKNTLNINKLKALIIKNKSKTENTLINILSFLNNTERRIFYNSHKVNKLIFLTSIKSLCVMTKLKLDSLLVNSKLSNKKETQFFIQVFNKKYGKNK